ncbi:hypothetical protein [Phenylobacterium montanum]|uniref:Uncharacterized protein n=1 Tax=Phenylobacterium montanum TaxID=2823693 RepID=A0A975G359_9CAUL|nr:hypothetical protein [Caulobacter sp. S6]QUD89652.1 hypothetical protein KCG34_07195 [Caulobacter sp. S6]
MLTAVAMAAATMGLAACEEHQSAAVKGAPEHLHGALSGDIEQQAVLAACYETKDQCPGIEADPALACAWRGVRLASASPDLKLVDSEAFTVACAEQQEDFRQRASIGLIDLALRVYGRRLDGLDQMVAAADPKAALYPSIEQVRERINAGLAQAGDSQRLPKFSPRKPGRDEPIFWSTCGETVCLEGFTPAFGGGVLSYRVTVKTAPASVALRASRASALAAAGLEAPAAADALGSAQASQLTLGPVCWTKAQTKDGAAVAGASRAPCRLNSSWDES